MFFFLCFIVRFARVSQVGYNILSILICYFFGYMFSFFLFRREGCTVARVGRESEHWLFFSGSKMHLELIPLCSTVQEELKKTTITMVEQSKVLNTSGAEKQTKRELFDSLRQELE